MKWTKFIDQYPPQGVDVLVTDGKSIGAGYIEHYGPYDEKNFHLHGSGFSGYEWEWDWSNNKDLTHWMPLPKLPTT